LLSEYLRCRPDHGLDPTGLGRCDLEGFLNRLAYLESTGQISRYHRNLICRDVRAVLAGIRALGLTRAGQPAGGLAGDFAIELDLDALRRFARPVYFGLGGLSNPAYYGRMADRLSGVFSDFTLEVFDDRHHFDPPHRIEPERVSASLRALWGRAEESAA